jgi:hypothetical protein
MTAMARIDARDFAPFDVPVSLDFVTDVEGRLIPEVGPQFAEIHLAAPFAREVTLSDVGLPEGVAQIAFSLRIDPADVALLGYLPESHVVASYAFDDGNPDATDASGHDNTGMLVGSPPPSFTAGHDDLGLAFSSAAHDEVVCGRDPSLDPAGQISLSAWFNPSDAAFEQGGVLLSKEDDRTRQYSVSIQPGGTLALVIGRDTLEGTTRVRPDEWHHVVATYDGETMRIYLDGALEAGKGTEVRLLSSEIPLTLGARQSEKYPAYYDGLLDDVRIYDVALDEETQAISPYW